MKDKIYGCVFGAIVGDALGAATEGMSRDEIQKVYGYVTDYVEPKNYLKGILKKGEYTDDTEQAIFIIKSINKNGSVDLKRFANYLINFGNKKFYGLTTLKAIEKLKNNDFSGVDSPTCGAAMRVYPLAILYHNNLNKLREEIIKISKITHNNKEAISGALAVGYFVANALNNKRDLDGCCSFLNNEFSNLLLKIKDFRNVQKAYNYFGTGTLAREVVPSAIATFLLTESFEEGMLKAVNAGGDTDTLASIYGAIAGAYYGYKAIPKKWIKGLKKREYIESLAEILLKHYHGI
ncbi:ADP-ribosylation/crystallin J1 [Methanocaldococcus villosus KIN24-T80]|uniref:ADP-ribosylation/crystallin J1 n=1 Tax=Methanocaldococcus villosus KIN24-T80 TaxID=1069083 RepID=N6VTL7_9EURY|nr:ADP-ribosylglycohydrolase family protein [Methanocaldococcus villosus]ENN96516.1 ADP-ribosylation/crystallin J1 [Methanocaldococcus villosus KIN24-T80]